MDLVSRIKNILITPKTEWPVIEAEQTDVKSLYVGYIMILAALPLIGSVVGTGLLGPAGIKFGLAFGIVGYVIALVMTYVAALVANALAPSFGGQSNFIQALKLIAFTYTASWVGGIFTIIPIAGALVALLFGLYGLYILYLGVPVMMKVPQEKTIGYAVVLIVILIVIGVITGIVAGLVAAIFGGAAAVAGAIPH